MTRVSSHISYMHHALSLARRVLGQTWPNPAVGAVIVKDGQVVGTGHTASGGRPHAEPQALAQAGEKARGATLYVTLEPCAHHGKTPPCTEAIIKAGIARVVVACVDPDPRVCGKGILQLEAAGIEIITGPCEAEARTLNEGFFSRVMTGMPLVTLKIATSRDGIIARIPGKPSPITGEEARAYVHMLRARHDAVLTGIGTVLADDPQMTCRLPGLEDRSPVRIVLDTQLRIPLAARILPAWILTTEEAKKSHPEKIKQLEDAGIKIGFFSLNLERKTDIIHALEFLGSAGITRLMVEGGQGINTAFLSAKLAHRVHWLRAPEAMGEGLQAFVGASEVFSCYKQKEIRYFGADALELYEKI